jgi:hypothetical protein
MLARKLDIGFPKTQWCLYGSDYDSLRWLDENVPKPTLAEIEAAYQSGKAAYDMKLLREKRDKLLKETDVYMISDFPLSEDKKQQLIEYRQALRDLPQVSLLDEQSSISWPTPPF